jgi:hypothetical protein
MALRKVDLTPLIDGVRTAFTIAPAFFDPTTTLVLRNGSSLAGFYTEGVDRQTLALASAPITTDTLVCYYNDDLFAPLPGDFDVAKLKSDYLFGLSLKDSNGNAMSDTTLGNKLSIGIARAQRELKDFSITPQVIKSTIVKGVQRADGSWAVLPEQAAIDVADVFEDPYDYDLNDYLKWGFLLLRRKPVISIERIRLIYPTGQNIIQYPQEWIKLYAKFGQVQIVPSTGTFPSIGLGGMYLPLMSGFLMNNIPQLIHVDYTAGIAIIPDDMRDALYKYGAVEVLKTAGQAMAPGVASLSTGADGLSESTTLTQSANSQMFGPLIKQYEEDAKAFFKSYSETNRSIDFRVA